MPAHRLLHFTVGGRRFALFVSQVMEIQEIASTTAVPGAPPALAGVVDIRGRIVTLIDLAEVYRLPRTSGPGLLAVQLAEPFAHLGILVPGHVETLQTEPGTREDPTWRDPASDVGAEAGEDAAVTAAAPSAGSFPQASAGALKGHGGTVADPPGLGTEILLSGARPALRLDVKALADHCAERVRQRFRIVM